MWLADVDKAVDSLASECAESDLLDLRRDADIVHSLSADVSSRMLLQSTETETQRLEVSSCLK